ncbi:MAG: hypothetical protein NTZ48_00160, partial [Candidatus Omnitrophica bacterium]|nr:hypothetical protein [Candidatus Omnitrophota bacterium]
MRKILIALVILVSTASWCFAQNPVMPAKATPATPKVMIEAKTLTGKVDSIALADPVKGTKSAIVVVDEK